MKTDAILLAYERFCRLMTEEHLYVDPTLSFSTVSHLLGVPKQELNRMLEKELGYSGEALIAHFRAQMNTRLRDIYGLSWGS